MQRARTTPSPSPTPPARTPTSSGSSAAAVEVTDLEKTYKGGVRALDGLSFRVAPGTVFALLGPNGAGKSTTVKILTTLSRADRGTARVAGIDVARDPRRVRSVIGSVGQKSGLDPMLTGRENLILQGQIFGVAGAELRSRADDLFRRFALTAAADRLVKTYSGGMQRKLDVALGLIHRPQVLFLDEPTTGLDPEARAEMWAEIVHLTSDEGLTILLTTHYLEEADQLAARLAIVDQGRVVVEGTPEQLKGELKGDTIGLELAADSSAAGLAGAAAVLARVPGVRDVLAEGRALHARADAGAQAVPAVLNALEAEGFVVASVTVARPSLDDVYLRYAGRSYGSAPTNPEPVLEGATR